MIVSHTLYLSNMTQKVIVKLKTISSAITDVGEGLYVIHHSEGNSDACPICAAKLSS